MQLLWVSVGLIGVLALAGGGALLWRRFYRDDPANAARRVFKNSAVTFGMRMVVKALDMVVFFLLASSLAVSTFGDYTFAALFVSTYLPIITEFGLGVLLTREVARDPGVARGMFGTTLALRLLLVLGGALPAALLMVLAYSLLGQPFTAETTAVVFVLLLTLLPSAYSGAVTALYNAAERMEVPAVMELLTSVISFLARIVVIALGLGILGLAWAAVLASTLTAVAFFLLQRRDFFPPRLQLDLAAMRAFVPLALPLMLNNLLSAVFFRFDVFIIRAFGGEVGQYNLTYTILNIALIVPPAVTFAVFPLLSRRAGGDRGAMALAQNRTLQLLLALGFPMAMGIAVLAPDLIRFFTQERFPEYGPSVAVLAILAWFLPLSFANGLLQYALIAVNRQAAITRAFLIGAVFNLAANLVAIPVAVLVFGRTDWALYTAAAITILSELVLYLVFRPLLRAEGLAPSLAALSWRPALAALAMGLAMLGLKLLVPGWPGAILAALVAPPVFGAALWALGGIGVEERALALRILGRAPQ